MVAVLVVIPLAGFSGLFYLETERVWLFLTPALAVAAGYELARRAREEGGATVAAVFAMSLSLSVTQEVMMSHWRW